MIKLAFLLLAPVAQAADLPGLPGMAGMVDPPKASTPVAPAPAPASAPAQYVLTVTSATATPPAVPVLLVSSATATPPAAAAALKQALLLPPEIPARPKGTLDTAAEVARDLAVRVEYFENGQAYYRAYTKGTHSSEENMAFVRFLTDYENELGIASRTHALLGQWLVKKSAIKDK